jgi:hypothetical protein
LKTRHPGLDGKIGENSRGKKDIFCCGVLTAKLTRLQLKALIIREVDMLLGDWPAK